jgi:hypothetical protein
VTPATLLQILSDAGIAADISQGKLRLVGSTAILRSDVMGQVRTNRDAIIELLQGKENKCRVSSENDCNTATPLPITCQLPEGLGSVPPLQLTVAPLLQYLLSATPPTVAVRKTATPLQHPTATPITGQVPEENSDENGDRCSVAVDSAWYGDTYFDEEGRPDGAVPELSLDAATADYERLWHVWIALADAGRQDEVAAIIRGPYWEAGERMKALLSKGHAA